MPTEYTLSDLVKLTGVSPRTVRYYITQGLLPSPTQSGPNTRYAEDHLNRLRRIRRLQSAHLPLAEIRRLLETLPDDEIAALAEAPPGTDAPTDSALDYIATLLMPRSPMYAAPASTATRAAEPPAVTPRATAAPSSPADTQPATVKPSDPDRAQWERISLDPNVELHIRRPLTRQQNRRVERLISIARQLLEED